ncbi:hypothetical protein ACKWTF_009557 [Chironomus riparius]
MKFCMDSELTSPYKIDENLELTSSSGLNCIRIYWGCDMDTAGSSLLTSDQNLPQFLRYLKAIELETVQIDTLANNKMFKKTSHKEETQKSYWILFEFKYSKKYKQLKCQLKMLLCLTTCL